MTNCSLDILNDLVEDIEALYSISIVLGIIHCVTAITSTFANGLVIAAILKTPSLHTPSNVLLCGLAFTDFLVGAVTQPAAVALLTGRILKNYQLFCTAHLTQFVAGYFLSGVSFLTLTAVSVDRFLALKLHLRYRQLVTIPRMLMVETGIWVSVGILMVTPFIPHFKDFEFIAGCTMFFGVALNSATYLKILRIVLKHKAVAKTRNNLSKRFHGQCDGEFNKIKSSSLTMAIVFLVFLVCYTPQMVASFVYYFLESRLMGKRLRIAYDVSVLLVLLNSTLNPLLYCFRISEIRKGIRKILWRRGQIVQTIFPVI